MSVFRISGLSAAGLLCLTLSSPVAAVSADDTIVVTATRSDQPLDQALARTSVITRDDIELAQAPDVLELLRQQAGVDINRTGGPGGQTSLFLRGSNSNHVLVLIDGVRVAAAGTGGFAWELIDPALIERIEIVRGPRAARWGSDAIGGVIQIFTRRPDRLQLRAGYGRYRDRSLSAGVGSEQAGLRVAARRVGGFSAQNERGFAFDPDDDGFEIMSAAGGGAHRLGPGVLDWSARVADGEVEFDQGVSDVTNYAASLRYDLDRAGDWQWSGSTALYRDRLDTTTAFGQTENITRRVQASVLGERPLSPDNRWLLGVDAWQESGVARGSWDDSRHNLGAWTGLDGQRGRLDYEASLRADRDQTFGSALTGNLAAGWRPSEDWRLFASAGRAFRAPNFSQLFSPGFSGAFAGNPNLDPETSVSLEAGADWQFATSARLGLSLYQTRIDDLIDFAGEDFQAINIRRARIQGAELSYRLDTERWRARAQLTWQDAEDRDSGLALLRRPDEKAAMSVDRHFGGGHWLGVELVYTGQRFDVGRAVLPSHVLINLRGGWQLSESLRLEGRLENAGDRVYEPAVGFNASRRALFVALSYRG
ncbi:TonB-dependent receptor domain-containing protein [Wenzhouxiangella limi]|uniref:TonB-dependent receptor n=1 Tax=Wenzhouxiangella limi TaxID=2707351 RepID=A0A845V764_9GAMM|nr:TonB-dependent receptor [Wenzhouxiangella limi]NDY95795.1 TonB-dependent receptor [Wenzhouxiangella limi]